MGKRQSLRSVVTLNSTRQEVGETLAAFYDQFHKSFNELDKQFTRVLTSKNLRNNYHMEDINTL